MKYLPIIIASIIILILGYMYRDKSGGDSDFDDFDFD